MDLERLEQYVSRCPCQELELRTESGVYVLGNCIIKPAWWYTAFQPSWPSSMSVFKRRGLNPIISIIEHMYPDFYAWLLFTFPKCGETQQKFQFID